MLFKDITYIDENFNAVEHAYVGTKNGVIDYISTEKTDWGYGEVYDGRGKVLIPGLVNNRTRSQEQCTFDQGMVYAVQYRTRKTARIHQCQTEQNIRYLTDC